MMYIYGASGHGKVVVEIATANQLPVTGFIDNAETITEFLGYRVTSQYEIAEKIVIAIGNNAVRQNVAKLFAENQFLKLIHPNANISPSAILMNGTVVMPGVSINAASSIGKHCIINTNASVDHDCLIEDFVHISPNVALAGNVSVGFGTQVGIGATVIQGVKIGRWCTIGAGTVVLQDIPDFAVVVGVPGKIIKYNEDLREKDI